MITPMDSPEPMFPDSPADPNAFKISSYQDLKVSPQSDNLSGTWLYTESVDFYYRDTDFHPANERRHLVRDRRLLISIRQEENGAVTGHYLNSDRIAELEVYRANEQLSIDWLRLLFRGINKNNVEITGGLTDESIFETLTEIEIIRSEAGMIKISEGNIYDSDGSPPTFGQIQIESSEGVGLSDSANINLFYEDTYRWSWVEDGIETATNHGYTLVVTEIINTDKLLTTHNDGDQKTLRIGLLSQLETEDYPEGWSVSAYPQLSPSYQKFSIDPKTEIISLSNTNRVYGQYDTLDEYGNSINIRFDLSIEPE